MSEPRLPRIGPCRDPLSLWFLEWRDSAGRRWRRYYEDRAAARAALHAAQSGELDLEPLRPPPGEPPPLGEGE